MVDAGDTLPMAGPDGDHLARRQKNLEIRGSGGSVPIIGPVVVAPRLSQDSGMDIRIVITPVASAAGLQGGRKAAFALLWGRTRPYARVDGACERTSTSTGTTCTTGASVTRRTNGSNCE